jgi:pimeloyl-ACP methyl ester carboxylesterase
MVIDTADVTNATLVVIRWVAEKSSGICHGTVPNVSADRFACADNPVSKQTPDNPDGIPEQAFVALRGVWRADFPKWMADNTPPFSRKIPPAMQQWGMAMMQRCRCRSRLHAIVRWWIRISARSATSTPTLLIHGDADVSAPLPLTGAKTAKLLPNCTFKVYEGAPHGLFLTHAQRSTQSSAVRRYLSRLPAF